MRNGPGICRPGGPKARIHTSLGQRPRLPDCIISEGLKARPIGPARTVPAGLQRLVCRLAGPLALQDARGELRKGEAICRPDLALLAQLQPAERSGAPVFPVPYPRGGDES